MELRHLRYISAVAFPARYPNVRLLLRSLNPDQQTQALQEGRIQVGCLTLPVNDDLDVEWVRGEPLILAMPQNHSLARFRTVTFRAIASQPHIMFSRSTFSGYYDVIVSSFRNAGYTLNIVHEADAIYTVLALVAAGVGVSLLPVSIRDTPRTVSLFERFGDPCRKLKWEQPIAAKRPPMTSAATLLRRPEAFCIRWSLARSGRVPGCVPSSECSGAAVFRRVSR